MTATFEQLQSAAEGLVEPLVNDGHILYESGYEFYEHTVLDGLFVGDFDPLYDEERGLRDAQSGAPLANWIFELASICGVITDKHEASSLAYLVEQEFYLHILTKEGPIG